MEITKWLSNVKYQSEGQILVNDNPELGVVKIAEIRGWSFLSSLMGAEDAASFQDAVGNFIAEAIQDKIIYLKEEGLDIELKKDHPADYAEAIRKKVEDWGKMTGPELKQEPQPRHELTFGQKVVGVNFNPLGNVVVDELKNLNARAIDLLISNHEPRGMTKIHQSILDEAIMSILRAQMMAVKSITFNF
jgi:hypothetical protein